MKTINKELVLSIVTGAALVVGASPAFARGAVDELAVDWYQWQETNYPDFSFDEDCRLGQRGSVWFLGGTGWWDGPASRECHESIPAGKRLFFPLINAAWANEGEENLTAEEKREVLYDLFGEQTDVFDGYVPGGVQTCKLSVTLDDVPVVFAGTPIQRVQSPPFDYADDPEAISDGYWVLMPKLSPGEHTIHFTGGVCASAESEGWQVGDVFGEVDVTYILDIVKKNRNKAH